MKNQLLRSVAAASALVFGVVSLTVTAFTAGCGGNGSTPTLGATATRSASAQFSVVWPDLSSKTRLIPVAAKSLKVTLQNPAASFTTTQVIARPATGSTSTVTFSNLPPGEFIATATAHSDSAGAAEPVMAQGSTSFTGTADETFNVALTLNSTIDHLVLSPSPLSVAQGTAVSTTVSARNAADETVVTASTYTFTMDDTSVARVTGSGFVATVSGVKVGTAKLTVVETESGKSVTATVTVTTAPTPTPTPTPIPTPTPSPTPTPPQPKLYVADNTRILEISQDSSGAQVYKSLDHNPSNSLDTFSSGIAAVSIDPSDGKIYIADAGNKRVVRVDDISGTGWVKTGFAFDTIKGLQAESGKIYVSDITRRFGVRTNRFYKFNGIGDLSPTLYGSDNASSTDYIEGPSSIYISAGKIYLTDSRQLSDVLIRLDAASLTREDTWDMNGRISGVCLDSKGTIYIADSSRSAIRKTATWKGVFEDALGLTEYKFDNLTGVGVDSVGRIYASNAFRAFNQGTGFISRMANMQQDDFQAWGKFGTAGLTGVTFSTPGQFVIKE